MTNILISSRGTLFQVEWSDEDHCWIYRSVNVKSGRIIGDCEDLNDVPVAIDEIASDFFDSLRPNEKPNLAPITSTWMDSLVSGFSEKETSTVSG